MWCRPCPFHLLNILLLLLLHLRRRRHLLVVRRGGWFRRSIHRGRHCTGERFHFVAAVVAVVAVVVVMDGLIGPYR